MARIEALIAPRADRIAMRAAIDQLAWVWWASAD